MILIVDFNFIQNPVHALALKTKCGKSSCPFHPSPNPNIGKGHGY